MLKVKVNLNNDNVLKALSIGGMVLSLGGSLVNNFVQGKQLDKIIDEKVAKKVAEALTKQVEK